MNPLNYASLEASKRLAEAGIVLKTGYFWRIWPEYGSGNNGGSEIVTKEEMEFNKHGDDIGDGMDIDGVLYYPAPCMAEVWRELPRAYTTLELNGTDTIAIHRDYRTSNTNPTDALIDLLIWVRKEANHA